MNSPLATPPADRSPIKPAANRLRRSAPVVTALVVLLVVCCAWLALSRANRLTIGVEGKRVIEIPGPRLYAAPFTPGDAVSLRIADVQATARGFRYDLRFIAYGPGQRDIGENLMLAGNVRPDKLPQLMISVNSILPQDHQGELFDTKTSSVDLHSHYKTWMGLSWLAWGLLLVPLILLGRKHHVRALPPPRMPTLAERLEARLEQASRGPLTDVQQADLELLLMGYWSRRLHLSSERLTQTLCHLKQHPTAGRQITLVEKWLHSRGQPGDTSIARELLTELAPELHTSAGDEQENSTS